MNDSFVGESLLSIQAWVRFANTQRYVDVLRHELRDDKTFKVFAASDGTRTQSDVAAEAGVSQPTVSRLWKRWSQLGIMTTMTERPSHLVAPNAVGVDGPVVD